MRRVKDGKGISIDATLLQSSLNMHNIKLQRNPRAVVNSSFHARGSVKLEPIQRN